MTFPLVWPQAPRVIHSCAPGLLPAPQLFPPSLFHRLGRLTGPPGEAPLYGRTFCTSHKRRMWRRTPPPWSCCSVPAVGARHYSITESELNWFSRLITSGTFFPAPITARSACGNQLWPFFIEPSSTDSLWGPTFPCGAVPGCHHTRPALN